MIIWVRSSNYDHLLTVNKLFYLIPRIENSGLYENTYSARNDCS